MREVAFDASPGETRAVLFEDGAAVELHIHRANHAATGSIHDAVITAKSAQRSFIRLANGEEAMIAAQIAPHEGAAIRVAINRESIAEPGLQKRAVAALSDGNISDPAQAAQAWQDALAARADRVIPAPKEFDDAFDLASAGVSAIEGGCVWFERTKAGLIFDVDGTGDVGAINPTAAHEIARLLRLFQIGGAAITDFVSTENKAARAHIAAAFDQASAADDRGFERTSVNGFGLMQVIRAKPRASILDTLFGTRRAALSDETCALMLLREASRSTGFGARRCTTTPAIATLLETEYYRPLVMAAQRIAGADVEIVADASVRGYGHIHVNPA